jgi:HNH endonuclease family protein
MKIKSDNKINSKESKPEKEIWKQIRQKPGYSISNLGNVRNDATGHIKATNLDRYGYPRVTLYAAGTKPYSATIHRLIMTNFYHESEWSECVNHIDCDRTNSKLSNLEWTTLKGNIRHSRKLNRFPIIKGNEGVNAKLTTQQVCEIVADEYRTPSSALAKKYNVGINAIERIRQGKAYKELTGTFRDMYYPGIYKDLNS